MLRLVSSQFSIPFPGVESFAEICTQEGRDTKIILLCDIQASDARTHFYAVKSRMESLFSHSELDSYVRFEAALKEVNTYIDEHSVSMSGLIALQENNELHISQSGEAESYLIRRGKLNVIIEKDPEDVSGFISISSGELNIDDYIVFSSLRLLRYATASQIKDVLSAGSAEGLSEIQSLLQTEAGKGSVIAAHVRGESIFVQMEKTFIPEDVSRKVHAHWLHQLIEKTESSIVALSEKTGRPYTLVKNVVFSSITIVLFVVLSWGVFQLSTDRQAEALYSQMRLQIQSIEEDLSQVTTQVHLGNVESANALLGKIETELEPIVASGKFNAEALQIISQMEGLNDKVNKITRYKNPQEKMLVTIADTRPAEVISGLFVDDGTVYTYTNKAVMKSVLSTVESWQDITSDSEVIDGFSVEGQRFYVLSSGAILEQQDTAFVSVSTTDAVGFKPAKSYGTFYRNVYFLSPEDNTIWKYEWKRPQFTAPSSWLGDDESIDLSTATDVSVDGSIYVLHSDGMVTLYHKGARSPLAIQSPRSDILVGATRIFVQPDMRHVYFLHPERKSIIKMMIVNRGLEYVEEMVFETDSPLTDVYVEQNELKMYVSDEKNVYEVNLSL